MKSDRQPVTLEDLLRLKRTERPAPEFWADFERELRAKQLAAIVDRRPWWASALRGWVKLAHLQLPVGATAILALTFLTVREYRTPAVDAGIEPAIAASRAPLNHAIAEDDVDIKPAPEGDYTAQVASVRAAASALRMPAESVPMPSLGDVTHVVPLLSMPVADEPSPSERSIAANLAAMRDSDPDLTRALGGVVELPSRARPNRVEPLAGISSPDDARRARLLSGSLPASAMYASAALGDDEPRRERLTSRLEDRLYDTSHRFGVDGGSVSIKF